MFDVGHKESSKRFFVLFLMRIVDQLYLGIYTSPFGLTEMVTINKLLSITLNLSLPF